MTNDQWAVYKDYADFDGYAAKNPFPKAATLTQYREDAYANINAENDDTSVNRSVNWLRGLEFRTVEGIIAEAQAARRNLPRPQFLPRDYLYTRDRKKIQSAADTFNRGVGH